MILRTAYSLVKLLHRHATCLVILVLAISLLPLQTVSAADVEVTQLRLESSEEGYRLAAGFAFDLSHGLEDAINRGIPMYFSTEVELTRPRWYWFDEKAIHAAQTVRIAYNLWTRQYTAAINGSLQQPFSSLEEALAVVLRPRRWIVAEKGTLKNGAIYNVSVRLRLDINQLPKPFLLNALNDSDWRLSSDWKRFTFKVE